MPAGAPRQAAPRVPGGRGGCSLPFARSGAVALRVLLHACCTPRQAAPRVPGSRGLVACCYSLKVSAWASDNPHTLHFPSDHAHFRSPPFIAVLCCRRRCSSWSRTRATTSAQTRACCAPASRRLRACAPTRTSTAARCRWASWQRSSADGRTAGHVWVGVHAS